MQKSDQEAPSQLDTTLHTTLGDIHLHSTLGAGSFAVVYLGDLLTKDTPSSSSSSGSRQVAVKTMFKRNLDSHQLALQRAEYDIHIKVSSHPNVVSVLGLHETDECLYIIMDYWPCGDLFDALVGHCSFDDEKLYSRLQSDLASQRVALNLFADIVSAVAYCHSKGVYHRDIKPENVVLRFENGTWRAGLSDFGLATTEPVSNEYGCGSVRYMSRECLEAPPYSDSDAPFDDQSSFDAVVPECGSASPEMQGYSCAANDVWSLGVILINLLSNKNPWREPSLSDDMFAEFVKNQNEFFRSQFSFTETITQLICSCFKLEPTERASITELEEQMNKLVAAHSSLAPPPPPRVIKHHRHRRCGAGNAVLSTSCEARSPRRMSYISWASDDEEMNFDDVDSLYSDDGEYDETEQQGTECQELFECDGVHEATSPVDTVTRAVSKLSWMVNLFSIQQQPQTHNPETTVAGLGASGIYGAMDKAITTPSSTAGTTGASTPSPSSNTLTQNYHICGGDAATSVTANVNAGLKSFVATLHAPRII